jgi:hypothetical protein
VVNATPQPLYTRETDSVPSVQEAGWALGPVCTDVEYPTPTGFRPPDSPAPRWLHSILRWSCSRYNIFFFNWTKSRLRFYAMLLRLLDSSKPQNIQRTSPVPCPVQLLPKSQTWHGSRLHLDTPFCTIHNSVRSFATVSAFEWPLQAWEHSLCLMLTIIFVLDVHQQYILYEETWTILKTRLNLTKLYIITHTHTAKRTVNIKKRNKITIKNA